MTALDEAIRDTILESVTGYEEGDQPDVVTEWVVVAYRQNFTADGVVNGVPDLVTSHSMPAHHTEGLLLAGIRSLFGE